VVNFQLRMSRTVVMMLMIGALKIVIIQFKAQMIMITV